MVENDTLTAARMAKADQGLFENEVTYGGPGDLQRAYQFCTKYPSHEKFVPLRCFQKSNLPENYRNDLVVEAVRALGDITVHVEVNKVSTNRPCTFPDSSMPYPFYNHRRNRIMTRTGTGWIVRVKYKFTEADGKTCPCLACKSKPAEERSKQFGKVMVWTAKHVIFDTQEAQSSVIRLFYDEEVSPDNKTFLYPYKVWYSDITGDWAGIKCVTHDLDLWDQLEDKYQYAKKLQRQVDDKYTSNEVHLSVLVSHPHGLCKHVTTGDWTHRHDIDYNNDTMQTIYIYTNCTCCGSSGAPVWIIGRKNIFTSHPHSRIDIYESSLNRSSVGFDW